MRPCPRRLVRLFLIAGLTVPYVPLCRAAGHETGDEAHASHHGVAGPAVHGAGEVAATASGTADASGRVTTHASGPVTAHASGPVTAHEDGSADCHALMGCGTLVALTVETGPGWAMAPPHPDPRPVMDGRHPVPGPTPEAPPPRTA